MIELTKDDLVQSEGHTSKGDQLKFRSGDTWYKVDSLGYEGYVEAVTSRLLQYSSLENFVKYDTCKIRFEGATYAVFMPPYLQNAERESCQCFISPIFMSVQIGRLQLAFF